MTWTEVLTESGGYLIGSFAIGWSIGFLITTFKKLMEQL